MFSFALVLACHAYGPGPTAQTVFTRVFREGQRAEYAISITPAQPGLPLKCRVRETVLAPKEGKPRVMLRMLQLTGAGGFGPYTKGSLAADLTSAVSGHNLADEAKMTFHECDYLFLFLEGAGYTPDRPVKVGQTFPVSWHCHVGNGALTGVGKILDVAKGQRIEVFLDLNLGAFAPGTEGLSMRVTSVHGYADGRLLESSGTIRNGERSYEFRIEKVG